MIQTEAAAEEAETEAMIAGHEAWKAAGRPGGTISHQAAMTELTGQCQMPDESGEPQ